jgi:hypothetical protein
MEATIGLTSVDFKAKGCGALPEIASLARASTEEKTPNIGT